MATINDLGKSITSATDEELIERLRDLRQSRRTPKAKRTSTAARKKKEVNVKVELAKMTPEMKAQLLKTLEGG